MEIFLKGMVDPFISYHLNMGKLAIWYFPQVRFSKHRPSGPMLPISQIVRLCVRVSVCLFTFEVPFTRVFAPTSRSRMSNIFRALELVERCFVSLMRDFCLNICNYFFCLCFWVKSYSIIILL